MQITNYILSALGVAFTTTAATTSSNDPFPLAVHNITRQPAGYRFENLAVRPNGQILVTTASPDAFIYQVDPLGILPTTLVYQIPLVNGSAAGIDEGEKDVYYVVAGHYNLTDTLATYPDTYQIVRLDMRGVHALPNGTLNKEPQVERVANITGAQLPNGAAFASPGSSHLLVADSYRGLIWNVDVHTGEVGITLNDTSTKGGAPGGPSFTGINGIKVSSGTIYWTVTGTSKVFKIPVDDCGNIPANAAPTLLASNVTGGCDDLVVDNRNGDVYVAGPRSVITRVTPDGSQQIVTGTYNSTMSSVVGPTALRFGRGASDKWSLYITTNGGLPQVIGASVPSAAGVSRIDLGVLA